jgi:CDP-diacylglycerol--serine O-phosphatidyltransferase
MRKSRRFQRLKGTGSHRGIYLLPNLFTSANLFCGFYAIIASTQGAFVRASVAIMLAAIFDLLDGKIARFTGTESRFGLEYDSLADAISFGVAPGILVYLWALQPFGRLGWLAALLFVVCGALRLARFNTLAGRISSEHFMCLTIPAAAFMIASTVLLFNRLGETGTTRHVTILIMIYALSFLMVSTVKYYSFKKTGLFKTMKFNMLVLVILFSMVIAAEPSITFFLIMFVYTASGPIKMIWFLNRNRKKAVGAREGTDEPSEESL